MFTRECRLIDIPNLVQAKSSNTTWTPEFLPVKQPDWCFMESLLWVFHISGMCCAIVGGFVTHMVGKFAHSLDINVCRFHSSEKHVFDTILCRVQWNWSWTFSAGAFHIELHPVCTLCKYLMYAISHGDVSVILKIYCFDTSNPCCPRSSLNFTHFVLNSFAFYFMGYALAVVPCCTSDKVMFLCHYITRSNSHNSHRCGACIEMFEGIQWRIEVQAVHNILK